MKQVSEAYKQVTRKGFTLQNISDLQNQILCNDPKSMFSKPIPRSYLSSLELPDRLQDQKDADQLPFPFVFTESRKTCLLKLLPLPAKQTTIIEGFSQTGKSNLAAHLCLMYRSSPQKYAVIYMGNIREFERNPIQFLRKELFYWFFEEINQNPTVKTLLENFMDYRNRSSYTKEWQILQCIMKELVNECLKKGKQIIFIYDTFNKVLKGKNEEINKLFTIIVPWLDEISSNQIYITTNTDQQESTLKIKSDDISSKTMIVLDETRPIPEDQLQELNSHIFEIKDYVLSSMISSLFQGDLGLILLFSRYCMGNGVKLENKEELFLHYGEFKDDYQWSCKKAHCEFLEQSNLCKNEIPIEIVQDLMMFLDLDIKAPISNTKYIDLRYVYRQKGQLKSINIFVKEMLQNYYWKEELIEKFINHYQNELGGASFGWLFDTYMNLKLRKFSQNQQVLEIRTVSNQKFCLNVKRFSEVLYGMNNSPLLKPKSEGYSGKDNSPPPDKGDKGQKLITFKIPDSNENTLYKTTQENFAFADAIYHEPPLKKTTWFNWKSKSKSDELKHFVNKKQDYFLKYSTQAKKQLGKRFTYLIDCFM